MYFQSFLYPRVCPACGKKIPLGRTYCACSDSDPKVVPPNAKLMQPDDPVQLRHLCAPFFYDGQIRAQLLALKFQKQTRFVKPLSHAMAECVLTSFPDVTFDVVTFVPMTPADIRTRSFNQSALLAQRIAKELFIECSALLEKCKSTPQQHTLTVSDRLQNLQNVFLPTSRCKPGLTVLLVDDIKTTGTTLLRCIEALDGAGIQDVYCVCAAVSSYLSPVA